MNDFRKWCATVTLLLVAALPSLSDAANIGILSHKSGNTTIMLEGTIEAGDFEKFLEAVLAGGVDVNKIFLATGGGDAGEAMRIGRLIRAFGFDVEAPKKFPEKNYCSFEPKNSDNCRCDSACIFLYLGGIHRYGDAIGVHRVYLNHKSQVNLNLDQIKVISKSLESETKKFFDDMGAPQSLIEQVNAAASDNVIYLSNDYVEKYLYGYSEDIEEWLIARCGSESSAYMRYSRTESDLDREKQFSEWRRVTSCFDFHLRSERLRNFRHVLSAAISAADVKRARVDSLLAFAIMNADAELPDLIGKNRQDSSRLLAMFGFGAVNLAQLKIGEGYSIGRTLTISLSESGVISTIDFLRIGNPGDDTFPYNGYFLGGISQDPTPEEFVARYGKPFAERDFGGKTNGFWFEGPKHDIQVIFDLPSNKLRAVSFYSPGYLKGLFE